VPHLGNKIKIQTSSKKKYIIIFWFEIIIITIILNDKSSYTSMFLNESNLL
jgi:hypothetical protein